MWKFAGAAFNNQAMQSIEHDIGVLKILAHNIDVSHIDKSVTKNTKDEIVRNIHLTGEQITDLMEIFVYGKRDNTTEENKKIKESLDKVGKFTALSGLALNFFSPVVNLLQGLTGSYIVAARRIGFNTEQLNTGYSRYLKQDTKSRAFYKLFPILMEEYTKDKGDEFSMHPTRNKVLNQDNVFIAQRIGDKIPQFSILNAMLDSHTVVDGKIVHKIKYLKSKYNYESFKGKERQEVLKKIEEEAKSIKSLYDLATLNKDGEIDISSLNISEDSILRFKRKVMKTNKYIIGNTDPNDLAAIKRNMWGRLVMIFRSWVQALGDERFMSAYYDQDLEETIEGRYKVLLRMYKERGLKSTLAIQLGLANAMEAGLTDAEIGAIKANARELIFILTGILAYAATHYDDDKDKEKSGMMKYMAAISKRLINELTFFVNPFAMAQIMAKPIASSNVVEDLGTLFGETLDLGYYSVFGTPEEYEREVKFKRALGKNIPIVRQGIRLVETVGE